MVLDHAFKNIPHKSSVAKITTTGFPLCTEKCCQQLRSFWTYSEVLFR